MDEFTARKLLAAFDRHMERVGALQRARRRMKVSLFALFSGGALVIAEAVGLSLLIQSGQRPPFIEYWGPLSAVGVALVAFGSLRTAFHAHREHVTATLATKASKDELLAIHASITAISDNVDHMRGLLESLLRERRA